MNRQFHTIQTREWFLEKGFVLSSEEGEDFFGKEKMKVPLSMANDIANPDQFDKFNWLAERGFFFNGPDQDGTMWFSDGRVRIDAFEAIHYLSIEQMEKIYSAEIQEKVTLN